MMGTGIGLAFAAVVLIAMTVLFIGLYVRYRGRRIVTSNEPHRTARAESSSAVY
jgi:hypothetical protein